MYINGNFFILLLINFFIVFSISSEIIKIKINHITTSYVGKKGILILKTSESSQYINDIIHKNEMKILFKALIYRKNDDNVYETNCGFLKGSINPKIFIFCEIGENIKQGGYTIRMNENFTYLDTKINIYQDNKINIIKYDYNIPFLYSPRQIIEVNDNINLYSLTLKFFHIIMSLWHFLLQEIFCHWKIVMKIIKY